MDSGKSRYMNNSFGIWRIVFTLAIMLFHFVDGTPFYSEYPMFKYHWYISVEFFFILSGFLMMQHIENSPDEDELGYIKKRIIRLYPEYFIAFMIMAVLRSFLKGLNIFKIIIPNWLELFMLQSIGTNTFPYLNNPAWYVSALLIGSYIIYFLIKRYRIVFLRFIGPLLIMLCFSYMFREYGRLENFYHTEGFLLNSALIRAVMGLTIGTYCYLIAKKNKAVIENIPAIIRTIAETGIFAGVLAFALLIEDGEYDFWFVALFATGIVLASQNRSFNRLNDTFIVKGLDKISYSMYLSHFTVMIILGNLLKTSSEWNWINVFIYIAVTIMVACVYYFIANAVIKYWQRSMAEKQDERQA